MTAAENREEIIDRLKKIRISPVAVHEAGHAVAACARRIVFARVVLHPEPRQEGEDLVPGELQGIVHPLLGRTQIKRRSFYLRLNDLIVMQLAGREAMELLFNKSAGHEKDYEQAYAVLAMRSPEFESGGQAVRHTVPSSASRGADAQALGRLDCCGGPVGAAASPDSPRGARGRLPKAETSLFACVREPPLTRPSQRFLKARVSSPLNGFTR